MDSILNDREYETILFQTIKEYLSVYDSSYVHKHSFDYFINHRLQKIIQEEPNIVVPISDNTYYHVNFGQIFVDKPYIIDENRQLRYITPNEARLRDLTYSSLISININTFISTKQENKEIQSDHQEFFKVNLARIPMMIGSSKCNLYNKTLKQRKEVGECSYDNGGYFIIKGKERVLVSQERINYNIVHVFEQKVNSRYLYASEIRSMSEETGHSVLIQMKMLNTIDKKILLQLPYISQEIPLGYIFKAFDFTISEIENIIHFSIGIYIENYEIYKIIKHIIREAETIDTQEKAISYISQFSIHSLSKERKIYYITQILNNELFPHLGIASSRNQKGYFLGHMLNKLLLTYIKKRSLDDRDHINNKRLEVSGLLLSELFRTLFKRFVRNMEPQLVKRPDILVVMSRNNIITHGIKHCFSTGNWGIPKSNYIRTGVSQILARLTYNSFLSHLKRILIPIGKEGKNTKIRQLHPSQIGFICPFETPEGHCLVPNTMILSEDGINMFQMDSLKTNKWKVKTVDISNGKQNNSYIKDYFEVLPTELYEFKILNHKTIKASGLHPFLVYTPNETLEWKMSKDITMNDKLICIPTLSQYNDATLLDYSISIQYKLWGLLRGCYNWEYNRYVLPSDIDLKLVKKDLKNMKYLFEIKDRFLYLKDTSIPSYLYNEIIPLDIKTDKSLLRMYLCGFFSSFTITSILEGKRFLSSKNLYLNSSENIKLYYKEIQSIVYEYFQFRFILISDDNEYYLQLENSLSNIYQFIDHFGYVYCLSTHRELFILKEAIQFEMYNNMDEYKELLLYINKNWIAYPLLEIKHCEVEMTVDFTTVNDNHTFVANGFITHNSAGIVKNMTLMTQITLPTSNIFIRMILEEFQEIIQSFDHTEITSFGNNYYKLLLDGNWIGITKDISIYHKLLLYKIQKRFPYSVSISYNENEKEILIFTDEGRMIRPLFNAHKFPSINDLKTKNIHQLIEENKIVFKDSYEIENHIIAMNVNELKLQSYYTLCEIHPSLLVGLCVGLIPYSDHTQAPRLTYHASMGKQAIGLYATTNSIRTDTMAHLLQYPEKPLVQTHIAKATGCDDMVFGCNLIVAIAMYTGFNQEDSVILNQSAIDRGLFRSFGYRTLHIEERKKSTTHTEDIILPDELIRVKSYNYSKLDKDGIVHVGLYVGSYDVVVGRVQTKNNKLGKEDKVDTSVVVKSGEEGYVDKIFISTSPEGYKIIKVKIRSIKIPEMGDKVASRSAQKGIVGMILKQEDMPFCCTSGLIPDLIINPLCLPSRMTINQIIESIAAKSSAYDSIRRYCTPFSTHSTNIIDELYGSLKKNGFSSNGREMMCNGYTGQSFDANIFIGPTYYHRLKHLVSHKIHARNHGSLQALTRQPVEGRSRDGGLRFGEMERDCMISHGVSRFLTERLFDMSDVFSVPVCSNCGTMPHTLEYCNVCDSNNIKRVFIPYACKLLFQELMAMGIKINLFPEIQH